MSDNPNQAEYTLETMFFQWLQSNSAKSRWKHPEREAKVYARQFRKHFSAEARAASAETITLQEVAEGIAGAPGTTVGILGTKEAARRLCRVVRAAFFWAIATRKIRRADNPVQIDAFPHIIGRRRTDGDIDHHARLPPDRIPDFFVALLARRRKASMAPLLGAFTILTASRAMPARTATEAELSREDGILCHRIPKRKMKVPRPTDTKIPLSEQALHVIGRARRLKSVCSLRSELLFENPLVPDAPLTEGAFRMWLFRMDSAEIAAGGEGWHDPDTQDADGTLRIITLHGTARASFKEWAANDKRYHHPWWDDALIERCLAHAENYKGAYLRESPLEAMKEVFDAWGAYCFSKIPPEQLAGKADAAPRPTSASR